MAEDAAPAICEVAIAGKCKGVAAKAMFAAKAGPNWAEDACVCSAYACKDAAGLVDHEKEAERARERRALKAAEKAAAKAAGKAKKTPKAAPVAAPTAAPQAARNSAAAKAAATAQAAARKAKWKARAAAAQRCAPRQAVLDDPAAVWEGGGHEEPRLMAISAFVGFALRPCTRLELVDHDKELSEELYEPVYLVRGDFEPNVATRYGFCDGSDDDRSSSDDDDDSLYSDTRWVTEAQVARIACLDDKETAHVKTMAADLGTAMMARVSKAIAAEREEEAANAQKVPGTIKVKEKGHYFDQQIPEIIVHYLKYSDYQS